MTQSNGQVRRLIEASIKRAPKSILLLGPRQTGKSTLIHSLNPDLEINLADEATFLDYSSQPRLLGQRIEASGARTIFVDEVQRLPSILNTIQALIDRDKRRAPNKSIKFYITGSSARKLRRGEANLLPGRVFSYELGPLVSVELGHRLDVWKALSCGTLPEPYTMKDQSDRQKLLQTYAAIYLKEEIQVELRVRNLEGFVRFLNVAAENSGKYLDLSKLAARARVPRQSAVRYFETLQDTLIAYRLEPYPDAPDADLIKHPRYFFFDVGVLNGIQRNFTPSPDRVGALFEHLVFSQILFTAKAQDLDLEIYNFRTRNGLEVDFVFKWGPKTYAVECKATQTVIDSDASALHRFAEYAPRSTKLILLTPDSEPRRIGKVDVLSLCDFLKGLSVKTSG